MSREMLRWPIWETRTRRLQVIRKPFSFWERSVALRYLRARRKDGGVALISSISFILIMLAVGGLLILAQGSALAPFIYTLF